MNAHHVHSVGVDIVSTKRDLWNGPENLGDNDFMNEEIFMKKIKQMKKMMSVVLATGLFAIGTQSFAGTSAETSTANGHVKFRCSSFGDNEEYVVNIDLEKRQASFFDNDAFVSVDLVGIEALESTTAPVSYIFEGEDTNSTPGDRLRITFAMEPFLTHAPTASLTLQLGKPSQFTLSASTCVVDDSL